MTPNERDILTYISSRGDGIASWAAIRGQFGMSEGALTVPINSLKRHLLIEQDRLYYRITEKGRTEIERFTNPIRPAPFGNRPSREG